MPEKITQCITFFFLIFLLILVFFLKLKLNIILIKNVQKYMIFLYNF